MNTMEFDFGQDVGDGIERKPIVVHCQACRHEWAPAFAPIDLNIATKVMKRSNRCPACGHTGALMGWAPKGTHDGDAEAWLHNGDTGISSETIWCVMMRRKPSRDFQPGTPSDPSDFGRCYRLLQVMPAWRERLGEVAAKYPAWQPLINAWDELTALFEEEIPNGRTGNAPKLYARMKVLLQGNR